MSPDTVSSLFPDRPIRPLPTRRLREKLPPDVAHLIKFPPSSPEASLFQYPAYSTKDETTTAPNSPPSLPLNRRGEDMTKGYWPVRSSLYDSLESVKSTPNSSAHPHFTLSSARAQHPSESSDIDILHQAIQRAPISTASSIDGYDSFENTNNKKKRKIPAAGDPGHGQHSLANDIDALSITTRGISPTGEQFGSKQYSSTSHANPGNYSLSASSLLGSGRGRSGRIASGRSPLRALPDNGNIWANRTVGVSADRRGDNETRDILKPQVGISGINEYAGEGQENLSLQHPPPHKATPTSSQFTFTCDSQVPGTVQWPDRQYDRAGRPGNATMGANIVSEKPPGPVDEADGLPTSAQRASKSPDPEKEERRERRRLNKELKTAAQQRRQSFRNNVRSGQTKLLDCCQICLICEYELVFKEPPKAIIRHFEETEREKERVEADRKRLREKSRAKARRKRNGKNQAPPPAAETNPDVNSSSPEGPDAQSEEASVDKHVYPYSPGDSFVRPSSPGSDNMVAWRDPAG